MPSGIRLRIGILGASNAAVEAVIGPAKRLGHEVVVVGSRSSERGLAFAGLHEIPRAVKGYREVIGRDDLDLVYVGLANAFHAEWTALAVEQGRNVLVEKPIALTTSEVESVLASALARGCHVFDGYHYSHHPVFRRVNDIVGSGEIGMVTSVDTRLTMVRPNPSSSRWSFDLGGGSLLDLGCYGLDACARLANTLGGGAAVASARAHRASGDPRVDARIVVRLHLPNGANARVEAAIDSSVWRMAARDAWQRLRSPEVATRGMLMRMEVNGQQGSIAAGNFVLPQLDDRVTVSAGDGARIERLGRMRSYDWQLTHIADVLGSKESPCGKSGNGAWLRHDPLLTTGLIDNARRAAGLQVRPLRWPPEHAE